MDDAAADGSRRQGEPLPHKAMMEPGLADALQRAVGVLEELHLRYAIVGGLAVSAWAVPRATRDADLWVELGDASQELEGALRRAGFEVPAMAAELQRFGVFRSRAVDSGVFVDMFDAAGPLGEALLSRRKSGKVGDHHVWLASAEDVAVLKAFSDRPRDLDDLVALLATGDLDVRYVEDWASKLDRSQGTDEVTARLRVAMKRAASPAG